MLIRNLACLLALSTVTSAHALPLENISPSTLQKLSAQLAESASSSQWQQLWKRSREAGHFHTSGDQARFSLPMKEIPEMVRKTIKDSQRTTRQASSLATYTYNFAPQITGVKKTESLTAICVQVDWYGVPENPYPEELIAASLRLAYPC